MTTLVCRFSNLKARADPRANLAREIKIIVIGNFDFFQVPAFLWRFF